MSMGMGISLGLWMGLRLGIMLAHWEIGTADEHEAGTEHGAWSGNGISDKHGDGDE